MWWGFLVTQVTKRKDKDHVLTKPIDDDVLTKLVQFQYIQNFGPEHIITNHAQECRMWLWYLIVSENDTLNIFLCILKPASSLQLRVIIYCYQTIPWKLNHDMLGRVGGDYGHPEGYCISKIVRCGCDGQTTMHSALFRVRIQKLVDDDRHEDTGELGHPDRSSPEQIRKPSCRGP